MLAEPCDVCGVRPAKYYRSYSGERLCERCLFKAIEGLSSRSLSRAKPRESSTFLVPITASMPTASLLAARVLSSVERRFKSNIVVAVPTFYEEGLALEGCDTRCRRVRVKVLPSPPSHEDMIACIRYDRAWSLQLAARLGADVVVLPLSRTDLTLTMLESLLGGRRCGISEAMQLFEVNGIKVINLFSLVEREAVAAMEFLDNVVDMVRPACVPKVSVKGVYMSVAGRPEMDYGALAIAERLGESFTTRCRVCGGFTSKARAVCSYCERLGLESLRVEVLPE